MRNAEQAGVWLGAAVLLTGAKFSYDHLRHLAVWPLEVVGSPAWHLLLAHFETSGFATISLIAPLGAVALALLIGFGCARRELPRRAARSRGAEDHE